MCVPRVLWGVCSQVTGVDTVLPYYDPGEVVSAGAMLLNASVCAPQLLDQPTFNYDLVAITVQVCVV